MKSIMTCEVLSLMEAYSYLKSSHASIIPLFPKSLVIVQSKT